MKTIIKKKVIVIFILFLIIAAIVVFSMPKDCGSDMNCFDNKASRCSKAEVNTINNGNEYEYKVLASKKDNCLINVQLIKLSPEQPYDLKQALEGKDMICSIPKITLETQSVNDIKNLNDMCTGQLKEAILQITIDKMYEIIVQNIGPIAVEVNKSLVK